MIEGRLTSAVNDMSGLRLHGYSICGSRFCHSEVRVREEVILNSGSVIDLWL